MERACLPSELPPLILAFLAAVTGCGGSSGNGSTTTGGTSGGGTTAVCGQTCQDATVGFALDNTIWLIYNESIAGSASGAVNKVAPCPLGGTAVISGTTTVASNGIDSVNLTYDLSACGNSSSTYSLTYTGNVTMYGTFATNENNAITFSSNTLTVAGKIQEYDNPSIKKLAPSP